DTDLNRMTPVVFVTSHSDYNSRARSSMTGGQSLIGKPFLAFELTVKALTLVLRGRMEARGPATSRGLPPAEIPAPAIPLAERPTEPGPSGVISSVPTRSADCAPAPADLLCPDSPP